METSEKNTTSFINVSQLLKAYLKNWKWVAVSVVVFLFLGVIVYLKREQHCEVIAQVLISDEKDSGAASKLGDVASLFGGGSSFGANRSIEDEMTIVKAHSVLKQTVVDLDMNIQYVIQTNFLKKESCYYTRPVELVYEKSMGDTLGVTLSFEVDVNDKGLADVVVRGRKARKIYEKNDIVLPAVIETVYGTFGLERGSGFIPGEPVKEYITLCNYDKAALGLDRLIAVDYAAKKTDIMRLNLVTTNPLYGQTVLNTLVKNYNDVTIAQKRNFNYKTLQFIEDRIAILSAEVDSTEAQVEEFMARRDLVNPQAQAGIYLGRTSSQEVELVKAEAEYELLTMAIDFLGNEANNTSMLPIMPSIASLTPLIEGYNELILKRLTIEASAKGDNVALKAINTQINAVRDNLLTALNKQSETSNVEINELRRQFAKSKNKLTTMPAIEREYANIMRQQTLKEQLYVYLLRQREETEMAIVGAHPRGVIIDEAFVSDAIFGMSPSVILFTFLLLGLVTPGVLIIGFWIVTKRVSIMDQAVSLSGGDSVIANIPLVSGVQPAVLSDSDSVEAQRVRLLRGNIIATYGAEHSLSMAVIDTCEGEASARVAYNLATAMALTGRRTLLLDADPFDDVMERLVSSRPAVLLPDGSLSGSGRISLPQAGLQLDYATCNDKTLSGADILASVMFANGLNKLKDEYEIVIVKTPSIDKHYASVEVVNNQVDMSIATVEIGRTLKSSVRNLALLDKHNSNAYLVEIHN
ncbi:MAG: hypothetical protein HDR82_00495 [Bacteroides sp.]|nr:hypothetical protein [Bacteroides sp.]